MACIAGLLQGLPSDAFLDYIRFRMGMSQFLNRLAVDAVQGSESFSSGEAFGRLNVHKQHEMCV